jgi:DNA topoisomerase-1
MAAAPIRDLGPHPADSQPVGLYDGKYGPYVKHGKTSASIPRDLDPAKVTLAEAVEWIEARGGARAKPGSGAKTPKTVRKKAPDPMTAKVKRATRSKKKLRPARASR